MIKLERIICVTKLPTNLAVRLLLVVTVHFVPLSSLLQNIILTSGCEKVRNFFIIYVNCGKLFIISNADANLVLLENVSGPYLNFLIEGK